MDIKKSAVAAMAETDINEPGPEDDGYIPKALDNEPMLPLHGNDAAHRPPPEIRDLINELQGHARMYGLDFFPVIFEMLDYDEINEVAAKGGFPTRYPHWRFGMEYERLCKGYEYGLQKIYEMVINTNPCYAYLMSCNHITDQKTVIGHVYAHCDFFKNNMWFSHTNRKMLDTMANHATRIRRYMDRHGVERVENFIDACLSLENLIDKHALQARRPGETSPPPKPKDDERTHGTGPHGVYKLRSEKDYMDNYINPPEFIEAMLERQKASEAQDKKFPSRPARDILKFLLDYAPLERWEQDVLSIVRDEAVYFGPQAQTKIMNEGWATYWHTKIMTEKALTDAELIHFADANSGILSTSPGNLNPYKLGVELWRDIEDRWNKGRFGKAWDECDDIQARRFWDKDAAMGRKKMFEVRKIYNDVLFVDEFLTEDFCHQHKLFIYDYDRRSGQYLISDRDFHEVKQRLLFMLTNWGQPRINVVDGNHGNRGELYLVHEHEGVDLQLNYAVESLHNLSKIWRRPCHLETLFDGKRTIFSHDGSEFKKEVIRDEGSKSA